MLWSDAILVAGTLWGLALLAVVGGTLAPSNWLPAWLPNDKLMHSAAYALLLLPAAAWLTCHWVLILACTLFAVGVILEWIQGRLIPGRQFCWQDVAANGVGLVAGGTLGGLVGT